MNWEAICTPKHHKGLGLKDPEKESVVSGSKLWWRWVDHDKEPWAEFWHIKYAEGWDKKELIHLSEDIPGSHIWRTTWRGKSLVEDHSFSKVRNGQTARVWEDSWKQLAPLGCDEDFQKIRESCQSQGLIRVSDIWKNQTYEQDS